MVECIQLKLNDMETQNLAPKNIAQSKGVMGGATAFLSVALAAYFSYQESGTIGEAEAVALVSAAIGAVVSIYGRLKARRRIAS